MLDVQLPSYFVSLYFVRFVEQSNNVLTGTIPSLGERQVAMENMSMLLLNGNKFSGTVPHGVLLALSSNLVRLDISSNALTGTIPTVIGRMHRLERLDAQNNFLEGSLPAEMKRMYPDVQLNLTNNL